MKKKIVSILLCVAMTAALAAGCGSKAEDGKKAEDKKETETKKTDVKADPVDKTKVYVTPDWVQSVIDGNQEEIGRAHV